MGFKTVFWKTLLNLTGWKGMLVTVIAVTGISFAIVFLQWHPEEYWPEQVISHYALNRLLLVSFFWISGFFLAFLVVAKSAASIAGEDAGGTLLLLVSKPVKRHYIPLAKLLALLLWAVLVTAAVLLLLIIVMRLALGLTDDALWIMLRAVPWLLLYSAVVALFFGTVTMALSSLTKNVIPIVVIMACLIMFVFLLGPVLRSQMSHNSESYLDNHLYVWDLSYHMSNAAAPFQEQATGGLILPEQLSWWSSDYVLPDRYELSRPFPVNLQHPAFPLNHVRPLTSLLALVVISLAAIRLSIFAIDRKDVH